MADLRGVLTVIGIGFGCALALAATHRLTADAIGRNETAAARAVLSALLEAPLDGADALPDLSRPGAWTWCGRALIIRADLPGYGGPIRALALVEPVGAGVPAAAGTRGDGHSGPHQLVRLALLGHQETPGITDFLRDPGWLAAFSGRSAADLDAMDALSGATITSRAVTGGLSAVLRDPGAVPGSRGTLGCPP